MFDFSRLLRRFPNASAVTAFLLVFASFGLFSPSIVRAQGTHLWTQSRMEEFEKGTPDGVAVESDGHLRQSAGLTELLATPSSFVWSLAADKSGHVYVGTGSPAALLRRGKTPGEKAATLFETKDLSVQALCLGPDGALYAAALPSGKVYKLDANATAKQDESDAAVVFDAAKVTESSTGDGNSASSSPAAGSHYIWSLTFDASGRLYIATGNPGAVYRVDPARAGASPELFFKSDEAHIRALAWDAKGNLIAGSDGSGLVYRIDPNGKGYVLFEAPRREITALSVASNGTIYAAAVGDKSRNPLPPLPVQGIGSVSISVMQPSSLQAVNASASLPEGTEIYALAENQAPRKLWADKDDIVYALAARPDGLLALTGNRGHIFRIQDDGSYADIAHLQAQQGLVMIGSAGGDGVLIGTGNTGKVFSLGATETHEYASDVLDAGALARFGRVEIEPGSAGYHLLTRSGNIEQPVRGWSDWQPLADGVVASPAGRFLQWKAVLDHGGALGSVGVNYLPVNSAPVVDSLVVVPGARINAQNLTISPSQTVNIAFPTAGQANAITFDANTNGPLQAAKDRTAVTVRWAAHDDDGDDLTYSIYLRGDGETVWRLMKDKLTDKVYSFDSALLPDGGFNLKVVASDAPSHSPGDSLTGEKISDRFEIDTTPPVISNLNAAAQAADCAGTHCTKPFTISFDAEDAASPMERAEYSLDAGPWQHIDPVGKLSDSKREHYEFRVTVDAAAGKIGEHLITVRAYDRYENVSAAKTVIPAQGQ